MQRGRRGPRVRPPGAARDDPAESLPIAGRKRLELAKALAMEPRLLLLDEAMAGLRGAEVDQAMDADPRGQRAGITLLIIEHVMKVIIGVCIGWSCSTTGRRSPTARRRGHQRSGGDPGVSGQEVRERPASCPAASDPRGARPMPAPSAAAVEIARPERRLWRRAGAVGRRPRGAAGRDRGAGGRQRGGQDDVALDDQRPAPAALGRHRSLRRPRARRREHASASWTWASPTCPKGGACSRRCRCAISCCSARFAATTARRSRPTWSGCSSCFRGCANGWTPGSDALGRRAADGGDRPRR